MPADNYKTDTPAKVPEHVQNYVDIFNAVTGKKIDQDELIRQSERVYNFQRVFLTSAWAAACASTTRRLTARSAR